MSLFVFNFFFHFVLRINVEFPAKIMFLTDASKFHRIDYIKNMYNCVFFKRSV
jgi:hypothetical protein